MTSKLALSDAGLQDEQLTASYRAETKAKQKQVEELSDPDKSHAFHVSRCAQCNISLSLPAIHFMCNHSYHQSWVSPHFFMRS
jgi:hypothetical protein